jgi:hypothetical protein
MAHETKNMVPLTLLSLSDVKLQIEMDAREEVKKLVENGDVREWVKKYVGVELGVEHKGASILVGSIYKGFNEVKMATERIKSPRGRKYILEDLVEKLRRAKLHELEVEALLVDVLSKNETGADDDMMM